MNRIIAFEMGARTLLSAGRNADLRPADKNLGTPVAAIPRLHSRRRVERRSPRPSGSSQTGLGTRPNPGFRCPIRIAWALAVGLWLLPAILAFAQEQPPVSAPIPPPDTSRPRTAEFFAFPESTPDPLEPVNRVIWEVNKGLMTGVIKPTSRVYRSVVAKPVRTGIRNMGRNILYPGRLINNLLQGKWKGARDESYSFLCNTTLGVAGFFDVAARWQIPKSDADFGQTFGQWGWEPACFLMLPVYGPSNERDALGLAADFAAQPLIYFNTYDFSPENPLTYVGPYTYFNSVVTYNGLAETVDEYVRFARAEADPYSGIQFAWTFAKSNREANFRVHGPQDDASLDTLESAYFTYKDPEFLNRCRTRSVLIPATGRKLKFTFRLQPERAPVVYIVPGLASHRLALASLALAELLYENGYSFVTVSSTFHSEFMENASTAAMPAHLPVDAQDLRVALTEIDRRLDVSHPGRLGDRALMGYSMGGLHTLYLAATEGTHDGPMISFDRYVALHTPVRMTHGIAQLDEFYSAPLGWPEAERTGNMENLFLKVAALIDRRPVSEGPPPFSTIESRFLIGLTFRLSLRDVIYNSQRRNDQGILQNPIGRLRRAPVYREILQYSFEDYFEKFVVPYYEAQGLRPSTAEALAAAGDLRTYADGLRDNPGVRVLVNQNDFLLPARDLAWLRATLDPEHLTVFPRGGHLGNFSDPAMQAALLDALAGLKGSPPGPDDL